MSREPDEILRDALAHFETMQSHAEHDLDDQLVIDAICMRLSAGIEVLATLDPGGRDRYSAPIGRSCGACATQSARAPTRPSILGSSTAPNAGRQNGAFAVGPDGSARSYSSFNHASV